MKKKVENGVVKNNYYFLYLISLFLIFSSCTKSSFEGDLLTEEERSQIAGIEIKHAAILVESDSNFSVREAQTPFIKIPGYTFSIEETAEPLIASTLYLAPFIAPVVLIGILSRYSSQRSDENPIVVYKTNWPKTRKYKKHVKNYNPEEHLYQYIVDNLNPSSDAVLLKNKSEDNLELLNSKGYKSVLNLSIKEWGLYPCFDSTVWKKYSDSCKLEEETKSLSSRSVECSEPVPPEQITAGIKTSMKLISLEDKNVLWEYEEFFLNQGCEDTKNLRDQDELILEKIDNVVKEVASNLMNKIVISHENNI